MKGYTMVTAAAMLLAAAYAVLGNVLAGRLGVDASRRTPADARSRSARAALLTARHVVCAAGTGLLAGAVLAMEAGWAPALTCAVLGAALHGGAQAAGALLVCLRHDGASPSAALRELGCGRAFDALCGVLRLAAAALAADLTAHALAALLDALGVTAALSAPGHGVYLAAVCAAAFAASFLREGRVRRVLCALSALLLCGFLAVLLLGAGAVRAPMAIAAFAAPQESGVADTVVVLLGCAFAFGYQSLLAADAAGRIGRETHVLPVGMGGVLIGGLAAALAMAAAGGAHGATLLHAQADPATVIAEGAAAALAAGRAAQMIAAGMLAAMILFGLAALDSAVMLGLSAMEERSARPVRRRKREKAAPALWRVFFLSLTGALALAGYRSLLALCAVAGSLTAAGVCLLCAVWLRRVGRGWAGFAAAAVAALAAGFVSAAVMAADLAAEAMAGAQGIAAAAAPGVLAAGAVCTAAALLVRCLVELCASNE